MNPLKIPYQLNIVFIALSAFSISLFGTECTLPIEKNMCSSYGDHNYFISHDVKDAFVLERATMGLPDSEQYHLFSHGRSGELYINGVWMSPQQIAEWYAEQTKTSDVIRQLNIYGCEFAKGNKGKEAVAFLEKALSISVSASDNITGIGGDWLLEVGTALPALHVNYNYNLQSMDVGIGFLSNQVEKGQNTLLFIDMRHTNSTNGGPSMTLQGTATIDLPMGVTVVDGGSQGFNDGGGTFDVDPVITFPVTLDAINITSAVVGDPSFAAMTSGYVWVEVNVDVNVSATVNLDAGEFVFNDGSSNYSNTADAATVTIDFTENPDAPSAANCASIDIGILLDDTGSMSSTERGQIVTGLTGMIDDLIAAFADPLVTTPYRMYIAEFSLSAGLYHELRPLTDVTAANESLFDASLALYNVSGGFGTNWASGLTTFPHTQFDLMLFFTDGIPNNPARAYLTSSTSPEQDDNVEAAYDAAQVIKGDGHHIFTIANDDTNWDNEEVNPETGTGAGAIILRSLTNGERSEVYTDNILTQDYFIGSFAEVSDFFDAAGAELCDVTALPIELVAFKGAQHGKNIKLEWVTASEVNNDYFDVEYSLDGKHFSSIGTIAGKGTVNNTSSYTYTHTNALYAGAGILYYRLKQVDYDGRYTYSDIVVINGTQDKEDEIRLVPNPISDYDNELTVLGNNMSKIAVYDVMGRSIFIEYFTDVSTANINTSDFRPGLYFVEINNGQVLKLLVE